VTELPMGPSLAETPENAQVPVTTDSKQVHLTIGDVFVQLNVCRNTPLKHEVVHPEVSALSSELAQSRQAHDKTKHDLAECRNDLAGANHDRLQIEQTYNRFLGALIRGIAGTRDELRKVVKDIIYEVKDSGTDDDDDDDDENRNAAQGVE
jgi:hypothetical protein